MKNLPRFLLRCSLAAFAPIAANAAGTYYTGNYQSPQQQRYNTTAYSSQRGGYNTNGYSNYNNANSSVRYNAGNWGGARAQQQQAQPSRTAQNQAKSQAVNQKKGNGFYLNAGVSKEYAQWQFEMKESNSILHYDNIDWYVFDITGGYNFDLGNTTLRVDAGFKYGIQGGEANMVDDDITNGGFLLTTWVDTQNKFIGDQIGHALSVGTSKDGSMMGFNVGFGVTDFFKIGNISFTPSVGYRYLKYKLETKKNYGLSVDTAKCIQVPGSDEIQCNPAIVLRFDNGTEAILWDVEDKNGDGFWDLSGVTGIDPGQTYYYEQPGTSHSYDVDWSGPYLAMDMDYVINQNNAVNGRVELGLPAYTATGDQPYRFDWAHPKSVEDKGGIGDAFHIGLGANWTTAITNAVSLSIGVTYDYYTVSGADAKTYLNGTYYNELYQSRVDAWGDKTEDILGENGDAIAKNIKALESECPGWVCSNSSEIESFYKSMGIRVGINALF